MRTIEWNLTVMPPIYRQCPPNDNAGGLSGGEGHGSGNSMIRRYGFFGSTLGAPGLSGRQGRDANMGNGLFEGNEPELQFDSINLQD